MNPFDLSASDLLIWGIVLHLVADWPLQNDWMANNKSKFGPAMVVHSGIQGVLLAIVFGYWVGALLALVHAVIDTRKPVKWWSEFIRQTQPHRNKRVQTWPGGKYLSYYDVGLEVRFWTDQVFHIVCIAVAALLVTI